MRKSKVVSNDSGVSEVIGTILLLGISVALFSVIYISVLSVPIAPTVPSSNIAFSLNETSVILTHVGGEPIGLDAKVKIIIDDTSHNYNVTEGLNETEKLDNYWGFGEQFELNFTEIGITDDMLEYTLEVTVIDIDSNSIVMRGTKSITNRPPLINSPVPYNTSIDVSTSQLNIKISDPDNNVFNWTIEGKYVIPASANGDRNGVKSASLITPLPLNTEIIWYVNATDHTGSGQYTRKWFTFITRGNIPPVLWYTFSDE